MKGVKNFEENRLFKGDLRGAGLSREMASTGEEFMVGDSRAMREVFDNIRRQAPTSAPILITGESGTGKELAARAIHQRSAFHAGRFMAINCASLPASLIASELFGYEKGAFTGANARKLGLIELADQGTLFLDEIGDLPLELQGHLLRFLQEETITRVGGHQPIHVHARIVSATHVDLRRAVETAKFREDLYYRINILRLHLPALRERESDVTLLAHYFLQKLADEFERPIAGFAPEALALIKTYPWPGNIREMIAAIRRGIVMGHGDLVSAADLALDFTHIASLGPALPSVSFSRSCAPRSEEEKRRLKDALRRNGNNLSRAARELNISRITVYRMMRRNGLERGVLPQA